MNLLFFYHAIYVGNIFDHVRRGYQTKAYEIIRGKQFESKEPKSLFYYVYSMKLTITTGD